MVAKRNGENRDRNGHVLVWEQPGIQDQSNDICDEEGKKGEAWFETLFTIGTSTCLSYFAPRAYESVPFFQILSQKLGKVR